MPRYEFRCQACDAAFERRLSMSAYDRGEGRVCPECGSGEVERAFSAVNVLTGSSGSAAPGPGSSCGGNSGFT